MFRTCPSLPPLPPPHVPPPATAAVVGSWGPAAAYNNLWVGSWLSAFSDPVKALGREQPLVLTRGTWAGGQKHGIVLWSSDIWSTFEELAAQVPEGVHVSVLLLGALLPLPATYPCVPVLVFQKGCRVISGRGSAT